MKKALQEGYNTLLNKGSSIDAVINCITILEDDPLFNSGKGSVFNHKG